MPKNQNGRADADNRAADTNQDERFRTFFTTSVADIPPKMTQEFDEPQPRTLFERLFGVKSKKAENPLPAGSETGEILLTASDEDEPMADLELAAEQEADAKAFFAPQTPEQEPSPEPTAPVSEPEPEPDLESSFETVLEPVAEPEPEPVFEPAAEPEPKAEPSQSAGPPQEKAESHSSPSLKDMLFNGMAAPKAETELNEPQPTVPEAEPETVHGIDIQLFGTPDDEAPAPEPGFETETSDKAGLSSTAGGDMPPAGLAAAQVPDTRAFFAQTNDAGAVFKPADAADAGAAPEPVPEPVDEAAAAEAPAESGQAEAEPADAEPADDSPEGVAARLKNMGASLTLRCALSGVLAFVLLHFGLVSEGLVSPVGGLDPVAARGAFYGVNLILLLAAMGVGYTVLRDGLAGLRGRPSSETMPALAAVGALIQALIALINVKSYQPSSLTLLSGIAALGLFMALLGNRIMLAAISEGFALLNSGVEQQGACRARNKDAIRSLARDMEQKDPWILLSRPLNWEEDLISRCFDERACERRTRKVSYVLLAAAAISGLLFLCFGAGVNGGAAAFAAVLCMGAPLSSTLIPALATLRLQRSAGAVGAMVPGWAAIEELGGIDTVQADAGELFTPECVSLDDIRVFKGGRIDSAIIYAASILDQGCNTLRSLFNQIIEARTDILYTVKDFEAHRGLGFAAWCGNNRVLLGTRAYMQQEGVLLPEPEYEAHHSNNGEKQILYLAVSGNVYAMFVLHYQGGRHAAHGLELLQRENIRLLVSCQDPSLTARHIADAYRLPEGMVTLLDAEQCQVLDETAYELSQTPCCMVHLKGFASLTGGLRAAEQAQNAETAATTLQIVSVLFSVAIAALLTSAGSVGALSVAMVLMYQAAWSALSIAVCALKQYR